MNDWILSLLTQQDKGIDPFDEKLLLQISEACREHHLDFRILDPIGQGSSYLDAQGKPAWELVIEFQTMPGTLPPVLVRYGIELDGEVLIKPRVKIVLPLSKPWHELPQDPEPVATAFDDVLEAYKRYRAELLLAKKSNSDSVLDQIRMAFSSLSRAIRSGAQSDYSPWAGFINGPFSDWISKPETGFPAQIIRPEDLRQHPDGRSLLIKLPVPSDVFFNGIIFASAPTPIPCMGQLAPSPKLQSALRSFLASGMSQELLLPITQLLDAGDAWWDSDLVRALIRVYSTHEESPTLEEENQRDLLVQLKQCGVTVTEKGQRIVPFLKQSRGRIDYAWDITPTGTIIDVAHTGFSYQEEVMTPFSGKVSLGPSPALRDFLDQCRTPLEIPEPDGRSFLENPEAYTRQLLRVFFQNQADMTDSERADFVRSLLGNTFDQKTKEEIGLIPKVDAATWNELTPSSRIERLKAEEIDFELAATTSSVLASPSIEILPGLRFERFQTFPVVSVCLPLSRDLSRHYGRQLDLGDHDVGWLFCRAVLEIAARNVLSGKDPFFQDANTQAEIILTARTREAYLDYRSQIERLEPAAQKNHTERVDTLLDQVGVYLSDSHLLLERIQFPQKFQDLDQKTGDEIHKIDFAFSDDVDAETAISQIDGFRLQGELLAPARSTYSLGHCPDWIRSNDPLFQWLTGLAVAFVQDPGASPMELESTANIITPLRSGESAQRSHFMELGRILSRFSPKFALIGETWESYAAHAALSIADIAVKDSDQSRMDLMANQDYWPGLMFGDTPLLPIQGTLERPRRQLERHLVETIGDKPEAQQKIRQCFDHVLGDPDLLSAEDRMVLFHLYRNAEEKPDPNTVDAILRGSGLKRLEEGDLIEPDRHPEFRDANIVHWAFNDQVDFGKVLTSVPFTIISQDENGNLGEIHFLAPLSVSAGPKWSELTTLIDLFKKGAGESRARGNLCDLEVQLEALAPGPKYLHQAEELFIQVLNVGYAPSVNWLEHRQAILDCLSGSLEKGFTRFTEGTEFRQTYVLSGSKERPDEEKQAKPSLVVTTSSGQHTFKGLTHEQLAVPARLSAVFSLIQDQLPMQHEDKSALQKMAAQTLIEALEQADSSTLIELSNKLEPRDIESLNDTIGLTLALHPDHVTDPTLHRKRPWSTYAQDVPPGEKTIHHFGYRFGEVSQPLIWSESLGDLDASIKASKEIPLVLPFLYDFFESFEREMTDALGDDSTEKIHGLIGEWHQKLLVDFPQLPPTTLVSRIHKNIYQTVERWNLVPDAFRQTSIKKLQELYATIEEIHQEGGKRARVGLITCEPGHIIQPGERDHFETTARKTPPAGSQADPIASGLVILLEGRGDTIKAVVQIRAKNRTP